MTATIGILNVGAGDTKLSFDPSNPAECIRAARIVKDMLRRGYALLIDTGKKDKRGRAIHARALDFDENTHEYIIADFDPVEAEKADQQEAIDAKIKAPQDEETEASPPAQDQAKPARRRGRPPKRISAVAASGIAVSRTAGG